MKAIITEARNDQLVQDRDRNLRSSNVIIHGVKEEIENGKEKDDEFVTAFLGALGIDINPESTVRLGKSDHNRIRPLKLKMKTEEEKDAVMARLPNLKNAEDKFKKISVTDDYTVDERNEIRKWVDKAKEQNRDDNSDVIWKVRGTPKNGMRLVKFSKQPRPSM